MSPDRQLTKNQALVLGALNHCGNPQSAYDILDRLREQGFRAPLQVYRALEKLVEFGLVHRLESLNAFVACSHPHTHDHDKGVTAFAICNSCGDVTEFQEPEIEALLAARNRKAGFQADQTTVEIRGRCQACVSQD